MVTTVITLRAPGHDDVPDADLHLEHPGDQPAGAARVPDPDRGAAGALGRPASRRAGLRLRPTAARSCGSTCSGSSAIPRSTSSRCRSSASSPKIIPVFSRKPLFGYKGMVLRDAVDRRAVADGVGAPHVHHRRGAAAVLLADDVPDRGADRHQVLQLDRHDVARRRSPSRRRCCSRSASW